MTNEPIGTDDTAPQTRLSPGDSEASTDDTTVSLSEAAARLSVSERTVLRRIQKGTLPAYKVHTPHGPAWRITLDSTPDTAEDAGRVTPVNADVTGDTPPPAPEILKVLEMLEAERTRNDRLQQENSQLYAQLGFVQAKLQDAEKQIRLLSAPKEEPEPAPKERELPQRQPWWRRFLGNT